MKAMTQAFPGIIKPRIHITLPKLYYSDGEIPIQESQIHLQVCPDQVAHLLAA